MSGDTYILTFDGTNPLLDYEGVLKFIQQSRDFGAWWHHIPFVFIVESELDADAITDRLKRLANGSRFLVAKVRLADSEGWLPKSGWDWIKRRAEPAAATAQREPV